MDKDPRASYRGAEFSLNVARTLLSRGKALMPVGGTAARTARPSSTAFLSAASQRRGLLEFPSVPLMSISNVNQSKSSVGHVEVWTEDLRCLTADMRHAPRHVPPRCSRLAPCSTLVV